MKKHMKYILYIVFMSAVLILMISCSNDPETPPVKQDEPQKPSAPVVKVETAPKPPAAETPPPALVAIPWKEAKDHIGESTRICGPVASTRYAHDIWGEPTYLYIGNPYPSPDRVTVVIWEMDRTKFKQAPEKHFLGKDICVGGLIKEMNGVPEIEVRTPGQIQIQEDQKQPKPGD